MLNWYLHRRKQTQQQPVNGLPNQTLAKKTTHTHMPPPNLHLKKEKPKKREESPKKRRTRNQFHCVSLVFCLSLKTGRGPNPDQASTFNKVLCVLDITQGTGGPKQVKPVSVVVLLTPNRRKTQRVASALSFASRHEAELAGFWKEGRRPGKSPGRGLFEPTSSVLPFPKVGLSLKEGTSPFHERSFSLLPRTPEANGHPRGRRPPMPLSIQLAQ